MDEKVPMSSFKVLNLNIEFGSHFRNLVSVELEQESVVRAFADRGGQVGLALFVALHIIYLPGY